MPLTKIAFAPGIDKQDTEYGAAGRWTDSDMVRFRYGLPEKIGGWIILINSTLVGVARDMHCLLYTSPSPRDRQKSRMPSSA